jgi:hypothetical protein
MMDLLWSCAFFATVCPVACIRPEFSDTTAIKQGVNPLVQALNTRERFVPNDVYLHEGCSFVVITGPNMVRCWHISDVIAWLTLSVCGVYLALSPSLRLSLSLFLSLSLSLSLSL